VREQEKKQPLQQQYVAPGPHSPEGESAETSVTCEWAPDGDQEPWVPASASPSAEARRATKKLITRCCVNGEVQWFPACHLPAFMFGLISMTGAFLASLFIFKFISIFIYLFCLAFLKFLTRLRPLRSTCHLQAGFPVTYWSQERAAEASRRMWQAGSASAGTTPNRVLGEGAQHFLEPASCKCFSSTSPCPFLEVGEGGVGRMWDLLSHSVYI
jgi:hypothetical protein